MTQKAKIAPKPVASYYEAPNERIIEFSFPDRTGGLIAFLAVDDGGGNVVSVYNTDPGVIVSGVTKPKVAIACDGNHAPYPAEAVMELVHVAAMAHRTIADTLRHVTMRDGERDALEFTRNALINALKDTPL